MNLFRKLQSASAGALLTLALVTSGCSKNHQTVCAHALPEAPPPLGYASDPIWQIQEANAEASDFVIYDHEFTGDTNRLNLGGEDHVKQIAARLCDVSFPVIIERSMSSVRQSDTYGYPVHPNPELDMQRREIVVQALVAMGIPDADQRVVVAPALAEGFEDAEAESAYLRGLGSFDALGGGYGAGFYGGFGSFGGFGF